MREIKFRWICKNIFFNQIHFVDLSDDRLLKRNYPSWIDTDNCEIIAKILPTGLFDKNGKEIWEGDIVKPSDETYLGHYEVRFNEGKWDIHSEDEQGNPNTEELYAWVRYIEVIGNIYENREQGNFVRNGI